MDDKGDVLKDFCPMDHRLICLPLPLTDRLSLPLQFRLLGDRNADGVSPIAMSVVSVRPSVRNRCALREMAKGYKIRI